MKSNTRRLFFALWPAASVRESIVEAALPVIRKLDGRTMQPHNLHVTLHFIGQVNDEIKDCMHAAARAVTNKSFKVELDRFGYFPRAKIFWMGSQAIPDELIQLHSKLAKELSKCGYQSDKRPYNQHVTLMRKCRSANVIEERFSIPWVVEEFVLLESIQDASGVNYQVIERYPLS